jgi:hypothetical protein
MICLFPAYEIATQPPQIDNVPYRELFFLTI